MRINYIYAFLLAGFLLVNTNVNAQSADRPWSIGVSGVKAAYNGDLGNGFFNFNQPSHGQVGIKVARYLTPSVDISLDGTYGRYGYWKTRTENFLSNMTQANVALNYKFANGYILPASSKVAPYAFAGLGFAKYKAVNARATSQTDFTIPMGIGANVNVTEAVSLFWQSSYNFTNQDMVDEMQGDANNNTMVKGNDHFMLHQVGVKFNIGGMKDMDGDGISDSKDACPEVPGAMAFGGCPDSDNDGIADKDDTCPNEAGLKMFQGCPDTDGDGVADKDDDCPSKKGDARFRGCPDTDKDGVVDSKDNCPNVRGVAANGGCPEISSTTKAVFTEALRGVQFETAKDVIKTSSYGVLDKVVTVMKDNPSYNLSIEGHTDSDGNESNNLSLSQRRADAVKAYLTRKGVSASRMTTVGYGESRPVATNATKAGKAENRRVEFKVSF